MTVLTDINTIKHLVDKGHTVYAGSRSYVVIKDSVGQYLIKYLGEKDNYIGLHGREGTKYEHQLNMDPVFID